MHQILICLELRRAPKCSRQYEEAGLSSSVTRTSFWVGDADEKGQVRFSAELTCKFQKQQIVPH